MVGKVTLGHGLLRVHCLSLVIIPPMPYTHVYSLLSESAGEA